MRTIYNFGPAVFDEARVHELALELPEASVIEIVFRNSAGDPLGQLTHLVEQFAIEFRNGSKASVWGIYLWKFRDSIPPDFGDDSYGYKDENPFGPGPMEGLMNRIRRAHDSIFRKPLSIAQATPSPARVVIDNIAGTHVTVPRPVMSTATKDALGEFVERRSLDLLGQANLYLADTVRCMLDKGKLHYEPRPCAEYPGMLRNTQVFTAWPPSVMDGPIEGLLHELCPLDTDEGPTPSLSARMRQWIKPHANSAIRDFVGLQSPAALDLQSELGFAANRTPEEDEVVTAIGTTVTPDFVEDVMVAAWVGSLSRRTVRDMVQPN